MISREMTSTVYDRIDFQGHGSEGVAEGLEQMFREHPAEALSAALAALPDLDGVAMAVAREQLIRETVAETGEERRHVADLLDAMVSMGEEAVLDLVEGEPTTLDAGLQRYVEELEGRDELQPRDRVVDDLTCLLRFPWPGVPLEVERPDDETVIVKVGGELVAGANHDDHGWAGMDLMVTTATNVHKAVTRANK